jgi:hypothetical protein
MFNERFGELSVSGVFHGWCRIHAGGKGPNELPIAGCRWLRTVI